MFLDAGRGTETNSGALGVSRQLQIPFEKWRDWPPSQISHHRKMCCEIAREWVTATDYSQLNGSDLLTGPRWLQQRFTWGASEFPIYWCEAVRRKILDCGALAALASEAFKARSVPVFRVQMVQQYSELSTTQWSHHWNGGGDAMPWTNGEFIYHEGCAVDSPTGDIKIWDASAGWWCDPETRQGYGSLVAVRVWPGRATKRPAFRWGQWSLPAGAWVRTDGF